MKKKKDIQQIYGYHSVKAALENEIRVHKELFILDKYSDFVKKYEKIVPKIYIFESRYFPKIWYENVTQGICLISNKMKLKSFENFLDLEKITKTQL